MEPRILRPMQYYGIAWDFLFYRKDLVTLTRERIFPIKIKIEMRRAVLWIAFEDKAGTDEPAICRNILPLAVPKQNERNGNDYV